MVDVAASRIAYRAAGSGAAGRFELVEGSRTFIPEDAPSALVDLMTSFFWDVKTPCYAGATRERRWSVSVVLVLAGPWRWPVARPEGWLRLAQPHRATPDA
jgi:hypothetical protein